jgi:phage terminase large subunit GpA-like protein
MSIHIADPERLGAQAIAAVLEPPPPIDYREWAIRNIVFTERETSFPGPYNPDLFPEFGAILDALAPEDPCRIVTFAKSAQIGGTVVANIFTLGSLDMDPGDFLYTHPTEENGRRWSKMKLAPMLKATMALARLFVSKSRDGGDSIMYKERVDGRGAIQISGANSPASLSQVTMRRQAQDDLAKWEMNAAGDPETQADSRSRAHEFAKIFKIGTPLVVPGCRITKSYEDGSRERPYVPCPHCDHMQVLEWENLQASIEAGAVRPHFVCASGNGCAIEEHDLRWMKARLEWRAENPKAKPYHRSFWLWSAYSILQSWSLIAREWLSAKGDAGKEKTFFNDTLGLAYRTEGEAPAWEELRNRAAQSHYSRGTVPPGALLLTLGVDCQIDRVEWQVVGWGREFRRWVIEYGVFPGHISDAKCQLLLDGLLKQTWPNAVRTPVALDAAAIDGNAWTEEVWDWVRKHPASSVMMVRGVDGDGAPLIARVKKERSTRTGQLLRYSRRFWNFGASVMKMALYRNLAKIDPLDRGYVGLPQGLDDEFYRQLTAERRVALKRKDGFTVFRWQKDPNQANEGLDTHLQAEAAAVKLGVRSLPDQVWARLEAERETPAPQERQLDLEDLPLLRPAPPAANSPASSARPPAPAATPAPGPTSRAARLAARLA